MDEYPEISFPQPVVEGSSNFSSSTDSASPPAAAHRPGNSSEVVSEVSPIDSPELPPVLASVVTPAGPQFGSPVGLYTEPLTGSSGELPTDARFAEDRKGDQPMATPPAPGPVTYVGPPPIYRIVWLICALGGMLALAYALPPLAERTQYAISRGRQRAEYEVAREGLGEMPLAQLSKAYQMVSLKVGPSVVHINLPSTPGMLGDEEILGSQRVPPRKFEGQGSGVIIDPAGYIVTNRHVVAGSRDIQVKLSDGRMVGAQIVGVDRLTDLAVLKIEADGLIAAEWGDSDRLEVGALVWALGSPFGLERSITFGILSAKHRADTAGNPYQDFLQTDAAVNPGNSGGPLVDVTGRVVGINTAIVGEAYQGISFSIPSSVARHVYERIRSQGRVQRGWLGVQPEPLTPDLAARMGIQELRGAVIVALAENSEGSPARKAGLQVGDVVVRWNGKPINTPADLFTNVGMTEIGRAVEVVVIRQGQQQVLSVVVGARTES